MEIPSLTNKDLPYSMDKVFKIFQMVKFMMDYGSMDFNMDLERNTNLINHITLLACGSTDKSMDKVSKHLKMEPLTMETGNTIKYMALVNSSGNLEEFTKESGLITRSVDKVSILGQMANDIQGYLKTIRKMDSEYINGLVVNCMKVSGKMDYNTVKASLLIQKVSVEKEDGMKVNK